MASIIARKFQELIGLQKASCEVEKLSKIIQNPRNRTSQVLSSKTMAVLLSSSQLPTLPSLCTVLGLDRSWPHRLLATGCVIRLGEVQPVVVGHKGKQKDYSIRVPMMPRVCRTCTQECASEAAVASLPKRITVGIKSFFESSMLDASAFWYLEDMSMWWNWRYWDLSSLTRVFGWTTWHRDSTILQLTTYYSCNICFSIISMYFTTWTPGCPKHLEP